MDKIIKITKFITKSKEKSRVIIAVTAMRQKKRCAIKTKLLSNIEERQTELL